MTDKYKALRETLENIPVSSEWKCGDDAKIISKYQAFVETDNGEYVILSGNFNFPDHAEKIVKYAVAACPAVIAELLAERDQFVEEKAWIDHQPDDQERLYELIRADAVRSYQRHKSRIGGQQTVRGDSFEDHVMWSALHHAREQRLEAERQELIKDANRYRWLRERCQKGKLTIAKAVGFDLVSWSGSNPDNDIDAAIEGIL